MVALLLSAGCVDSFAGANVQLTLREGVQIPADPDDTPVNGQPAADTHFALVSFQFEVDAAGEVVRSFAFDVFDFEIRRHIELGSPCLIDRDGDRFPGLHVTQVAAKLREVTGISDPLNPPAGASERDVGDVLDADARVALLPMISAGVRSVVSTSAVAPPAIDAVCVEDGGSDPARVPPPDCTGQQSNDRRLALCEAFWAANPDYYEGSDKVFSVPLNGQYFGSVDGRNPINGAPIGGVSFDVDAALDDFDALAITWRYKDLDGDGEPDIPDTAPDSERNPIGVVYLEGRPERVARGVINVPLANQTFSTITGEAVVIPSLDEDEVSF